MMQKETIEERFGRAAHNLCEGWRSFDFLRQVSERFSKFSWVPIEDSDGGHPAESFNRDISNLGAVVAAKVRLQTNSGGEVLLGMAASNRFDLTIEFLVLRPAWKSLFD